MLTLTDKIEVLKKCLLAKDESYADSFKTDILIFLDDFKEDDQNLLFLHHLRSQEEIYDWVQRLTSKIIMKYDEKDDQLFDFIFYAITD